MKLMTLFLVTIASIFVLDMLWLGFIAKSTYAQNLGLLLRKSGGEMAPIWWSAFIVYICIAIGIVFLVLPKANGDYMLALYWGALLGFVTYGIYDFTNYSILANWPLKITIIDFIWGMVLCGLSSLSATFIQDRFLN